MLRGILVTIWIAVQVFVLILRHGGPRQPR